MPVHDRTSRSVSPLIRDAVVVALGVNDPIFGDQRGASGSLPQHKSNEATHTDALRTLLRRRGPEAVIQAGHQLGCFGDHPILQVLALSGDPFDLIQKIERLEPLFHLGNQTRYTLDRNSIGVLHVPKLNAAIDVSESLFVCGAQIGMLERVGCQGLSVSFEGSHVVWGSEATSDRSEGLRAMITKPPSASLSWTLSWSTSPLRDIGQATGSITHDLRHMVRDRPASRWTLALAATQLGTSSRTLQRMLANEQSRFADLLVRTRLDVATELLARTSLSIGTIALLSGFSDHSHLCSTMQRIRGLPPSAIRSTAEQELMTHRANAW